MKRFLFISVSALLVGTLIVNLIKHDKGYILISIGDYTLEMSFWIGVLFLTLLVLVFWVVKGIIKKTWSSLVGGTAWFRSNKDRTAIKRTNAGLIHFIEGNWSVAKKELLGAARKTDKPLVHYLAAARSAHEMGLSEETQFLLHEAEKVAPENELAVALSQARIQLSDNQNELCLVTLERARKYAKNHPVVIDLLRQVYIRLRDWQALIALLPAIKANKLMAENYVEFEEYVFVEAINGCHEVVAEPAAGIVRSDVVGSEEAGNQEKEKHLNAVWQKIPKSHKKNNRVVFAYAKQLHELGCDDKAEIIIRTALNREWSSDLAALYGALNTTLKKERLITAEAWLRDRPGDASLLFMLGRIAIENELWGKAKAYLEDSLKLQENPKTYAELAHLLAQLGDHKASTKLYQKGLEIVANNGDSLFR